MILVTGGAGYIGSHNVIALLDAGYDVVIFDNLELGHIETVGTLKNINSNGRVVDFVKGDLQNLVDIKSVFEKYNIDAVVHFAAYSQVAESVKNPQKYYFNNGWRKIFSFSTNNEDFSDNNTYSRNSLFFRISIIISKRIRALLYIFGYNCSYSKFYI